MVPGDATGETGSAHPTVRKNWGFARGNGGKFQEVVWTDAKNWLRRVWVRLTFDVS